MNLLCKPEQLELIEGVPEAVRYINQKGYLAIVVTNQPVIARNLCSIDELNYIHAKLETLLGHEHAYLNAIYYCPHHPDNGYPEERKEYKIKCMWINHWTLTRVFQLRSLRKCKESRAISD